MVPTVWLELVLNVWPGGFCSGACAGALGFVLKRMVHHTSQDAMPRRAIRARSMCDPEVIRFIFKRSGVFESHFLQAILPDHLPLLQY